MDARHAVMHYKYKGDRVDEVLRSIVLNHVSRLESENKRLREALETIAKMQLSDDYSDAYYNEQYFNIVKHARQALEGGE